MLNVLVFCAVDVFDDLPVPWCFVGELKTWVIVLIT